MTSSSVSNKALKIAIITTVAAATAYFGYRAYRKKYPFEELGGKESAEKSATGDEIPTEEVSESPISNTDSTEELTQSPAELAKNARLKGNELYTRGSHQQAVTFYTEAINFYPKDDKDLALAYSNRAACYLHMNRFTAVIDDCTKALEISPELVKALDRRSRANEHLGNLMDALVDSTAACVIDDFQTANLVRRVETMLRQWSTDLANEDFKTKELKLSSKSLMDEFFSTFPGEFDVEVIDAAADENISSESEQLNKAITALHSKKYQEAYDLACQLASSLTNDKLKAKALSLKASFEILKGDIKSAEEALKQSVELDSSDPNVPIKAALVQLENNDFLAMSEQLERAEKLKNDNPALYYHRGEVLALSGSLDPAVTDFETAERLYPAFEVSYVHHARALLGLNRIEQAEKLLIDAQKRFKDSVEVQNALGEVYVCKKDFPAAHRAFTGILAKNRKSPQVYLNMALLAMTENSDYQAAEKHLKKALEIEPGFEAAHLQLANLMVSRSRDEEAIKHFDNAIKHARSLQELVSVHSLKCASLVQLRIMKDFPTLAGKMKALIDGKQPGDADQEQ